VLYLNVLENDYVIDLLMHSAMCARVLRCAKTFRKWWCSCFSRLRFHRSNMSTSYIWQNRERICCT